MKRYVATQTFTVNANWVCPPGVTLVLLQGFGGGGGTNSTTSGAGGALMCQQLVQVIPGSTYAVSIGLGGTSTGASGAATTFSLGGTTLASFLGAGGTTNNANPGGNTSVMGLALDLQVPQTGGVGNTPAAGKGGWINAFAGGAVASSKAGGGAGAGGAGAVGLASGAANTGAGAGGDNQVGGSGHLRLTFWPGMASQTFLNNSTWTAPLGYAGPVIAIGCGGGGAGGGQCGGGGASLQYSLFQAVPNGQYSIVIGAGGLANYSHGGVTTITNPSSVVVFGALGGGGAGTGSATPGTNNSQVSGTGVSGNYGYVDYSSGGPEGGNGNTSLVGPYVGGTGDGGLNCGGGAGPYGNGAPSNTNATANTGAGGGNSKNGGSGQVTVFWMPSGNATIQTFTASGTWTAPPGCDGPVLLYGFGGGGGGGGGGSGQDGAGGGGGSTAQFIGVNVVANTAYTVTIGAGGTAGPAAGGTVTNGGNGGATSFGSIASMMGACGGGCSTGTNWANGGAPDTVHVQINANNFMGSGAGNWSNMRPGWGQQAGNQEGYGNVACASWQGFAAGTQGATGGGGDGGGGGGGGPNGAGGNGSQATAANATTPAANSGAGGGGGASNSGGGAGTIGGSGLLIVASFG